MHCFSCVTQRSCESNCLLCLVMYSVWCNYFYRFWEENIGSSYCTDCSLIPLLVLPTLSRYRHTRLLQHLRVQSWICEVTLYKFQKLFLSVVCQNICCYSSLESSLWASTYFHLKEFAALGTIFFKSWLYLNWT